MFKCVSLFGITEENKIKEEKNYQNKILSLLLVKRDIL